MGLLCKIVPLVFNRVAFGSMEHWFPIVMAILLGIGIMHYANKKLGKKNQQHLVHFIAIAVSLTVISFHLHKYAFGHYDIRTDLPLYLCSLLAILIPVFTYYRKYWMYEVLVFWVVAGTLQAVITPDIATGFPTFDYIRYWVVHLGLLLIIGYATFVFKMLPNFKSVFRSFFVLQLYVVAMMIINYILKANYFYLNQKPKSASLLDYFGEWPVYIIVVQLIIIPYFLLVYLPFYIYQKKSKSQA